MDGVFLKLFNMSMAAGWLIIAVIVLRLIFKKAPKWLSCILWAMVAVRLVCPFSFESSFSLVPSAETISPAVVQYGGNSGTVQDTGNPGTAQYIRNPWSTQYTGLPEFESGVPYTNHTFNAVINESFAPAPGDSVNPLYVLIYIAGILWAIGVIVILGCGLVSFWRICHKVREAVPLQDNIWLCDAVKSPFILGVIRPRVYLSSSTNDEQGKYVLAHEQAHLKRKDHWWKMLGYLLLAVYWFHPLVWAAYILFCRDIELACDEKTVQHMDMEEKKAYSEALVASSMQKKMILISPLAFGEVGVKERVKMVLHYKKPAFWIVMAALAVCVVVALCFLTNPKRDTFDIRIVIPAGSEGGFYYSEEEICPNGSRVTLSSGEGIGDTEVVLYPVDREDERNYEPTYMTPGLPVKMNAQKGAWFRVGINGSNPTNEDINVYVRVKGVTVRIADLNARGGMDSGAGEDSVGGIANIGMEGTGVTSGGEREGAGSIFGAGEEGEMIRGNEMVSDGEDTITFLGAVVENTVDTMRPGILVKPMGGGISYDYIWFELPDGEADWAKQVYSIVSITCKNSFEESNPPCGVLVSIDEPQIVLETSDDFMDSVIDEFLDTICSEPKLSSNPQDYIDAHVWEYDALVDYGEYTLRYCFQRFRNGNETGLEGKVMAFVCEEILREKYKDPVVTAGEAATGQDWYDTLFAHGSNLVEPYL